MENEMSSNEKKLIYDRLKNLPESEILERLRKAGIGNIEKLDKDDFRLLKSGRNCHTLLTNKFQDRLPDEIKNNCDTTSCKVKFVFLPEKDDFYPNKKFAQLELKIPDNYLGIEINQELKNQIEKFRNIGVQKIIDKDGKESSGYISIDKDLKTMIFVSTSNTYIPDKLGENPISQRQKDSLKAGYSVPYLDYKNKDGEIKKKMNLKLSPFIEGKILFSDATKLKVEEKIEQSVEQKIEQKKSNSKSVKV